MGRITRYVCWRGHDAGGCLPPVDVLAGILVGAAANLLPSCAPLTESEALVIVPPQWIGDWEHGHALAPGYQYVWRAPLAQLHALPEQAAHTPYRPPTLPASATGPRGDQRHARRRALAEQRRSS